MKRISILLAVTPIALLFTPGFAFEAISVAVGFRNPSPLTLFGANLPYPGPQLTMGMNGGRTDTSWNPSWQSSWRGGAFGPASLS